MMQTKHSPRPVVLTVLLAVAACLIYGINSGIRSNFGIMLGAISENSGVSPSSVSFVLAVGQLVFGIMQPVFGLVALRKSNRFVLCCGVVLVAGGLLLIPLCRSFWLLLCFLGVMLPSGLGAISFGIIMSALTPHLSQGSVATVSGFVNASSGVGSSVLSPAIQGSIAMGGITSAMLFLSVPVALLLPVCIWLCRPKAAGTQAKTEEKKQRFSLKTLLAESLGNRNYRFLMIAFFTCGFHMAIIETHLFTQITTYGFSGQTAAYAFSIYGIAAVVGSIISGVLCSKIPMQRVLGTLYGLRLVGVMLFLLLPKTLFSVCGFTVLLGMTGNSTVPPTSGLVGREFGAEKLATLFGVVFVAHQIGSFLSAWLGGISVAATGTYVLIWGISALLSGIAAFASFCIGDRQQAAVS